MATSNIFDSMQYVFSKEKAYKVIEEFEDATLTKFNKLYYHKYDTSKSKIRWDFKTRTPYVIVQSTKLECEHGKNRDFIRNEKRRQLEARKRYNVVLPSKKKDCKATISMLEVIMFPQYEIENTIRRERVFTSQKLRDALHNKAEDVMQEYRCYLKFPPAHEHSGHIVDEVVDYLTMSDDRILVKIAHMVENGKCTVNLIKKSLQSFVESNNIPGCQNVNGRGGRREFRDMPDEIVNQCLVRIAAAEHIPQEDIERDENFFYVRNDLTPDEWFKVYFGSGDSFPVCLCDDFQHSLLPCKHMFAIVSLYPDMSWTSLPDWYRTLLAVTAPAAADQQKRARDSVERAAAVLDQLRAALFSDRLTHDDVVAMEIGLNTIRDQLPVRDDDDDDDVKAKYMKLGGGGAKQDLCLKPVKKKFTPPLTAVKHRLIDDPPVLTNGPHQVTLLQLKRLEPALDTREKELVRVYDKNFKMGDLCNDIVDSFLWVLCQRDRTCLYLPANLVNVIEDDQVSVEQAIHAQELSDKRYVFLPWQPFGHCMVLLVVDVGKRALYYLHPYRAVDVAADMHALRAKDFVSRLFREKFDFDITTFAALERTLQRPAPAYNIAVLVCVYAKWLCDGDRLPVARDEGGDANADVYRKDVYDVVAGSCLDGSGKKERCRMCTDGGEPGDRIVCQRCSQQFHVACLGSTVEQLQNLDYFICP